MLHQIDPSEKVINEIPKLFKTLKINQLLRAANIKKSRGISVLQVYERPGESRVFFYSTADIKDITNC